MPPLCNQRRDRDFVFMSRTRTILSVVFGVQTPRGEDTNCTSKWPCCVWLTLQLAWVDFKQGFVLKIGGNRGKNSHQRRVYTPQLCRAAIFTTHLNRWGSFESMTTCLKSLLKIQKSFGEILATRLTGIRRLQEWWTTVTRPLQNGG